MSNIRKIILLVTIISAFAVSLSACGRYSSPSPVEGSGFPHQYPKN
ncbi:MAG: hypothetical protein II830_00535 [Alphaproteobacteria bacterium]|nr:hypothetical protein [Alphaproteobacteria bacterium]